MNKTDKAEQQTGEGAAPRKEKLFKTARTQFSFGAFKTGEVVSVQYYGSSMDGTIHWYWVNDSDVTYNNQNHLTDFVL